VGIVGELPSAAAAGRLGFVSAGDVVALVGPFRPSLPGSELARLRGEALPDGLADGPALEAAAAAIAALRDAVRAGGLSSAHDVAEGGFAVALAECCLAGEIGARISTGPATDQDDALRALFGESAAGFIVSGPRAAIDALPPILETVVCGEVGGDRLTIDVGGERIDVALADLRAAWSQGLAGVMA